MASLDLIISLLQVTLKVSLVRVELSRFLYF